MVDFNKLRQRKGSNMESLQKKLESTSQNNGFKKDERIWKPTAKEGKSTNIIRFLPIPAIDIEAAEAGTIQEVDLTPMAKILHHSFQSAKGWMIEKSIQTFGEECPIRNHDTPLWKKQKETNDEALKKILIKRLPKTTYYANILVIKDGTNPENNGKVFLYEFGETIRKLLEKAAKPEFEGEMAFDPFDMWEGANLILNLTYEKKKIGEREAMVPKFDAVKWANPAPLGEDTEIEEIWKKEYSIAEFYDRKNFKSYEELEKKFFKIMGYDDSGKPSAPGSTISKSAESMLNEMTESKPKEAPVKEAKQPEAKVESSGVDSSLDEFEKMLSGM